MKINFKKILKEVMIFALMIFVVANIMSYIRAPKLDSDRVPNIEATLINGEMFESSTLQGKPLVIHFWATWCPTCRVEASAIESISKQYEVLSIAVNSGSDTELQTYLTKNNYHYRVINDTNGELSSRFKVEAFPTTFIYDGKGKLRFTEVGYTTAVGLLGRLELIK